MKGSFPRQLRAVPFALVAGLAVIVAQSCDERASRERAAVTTGAQPAAPGITDAGQARSEEERRRTGGNIEEPPLPCSAGGEACPDGFMCCPQCCLADLPPICVPKTDGGCPLPDLTVDEAALAKGTYLETIDGTKCEVDEGCLLGPGKRKVLRFDVSVPNRGARDLVLGNPDAGGPFVYAKCHEHYHFTGFARYQLVSQASDEVVLVGRKQAFCARDSMRAAREAPLNPKYDCSMQGISVGWSDVYDPSLPCQFLDVTDIPSGEYRLEVDVNPDRTMTEARYDNNKASLRIKIP